MLNRATLCTLFTQQRTHILVNVLYQRRWNVSIKIDFIISFGILIFSPFFLFFCVWWNGFDFCTPNHGYCCYYYYYNRLPIWIDWQTQNDLLKIPPISKQHMHAVRQTHTHRFCTTGNYRMRLYLCTIQWPPMDSSVCNPLQREMSHILCTHHTLWCYR